VAGPLPAVGAARDAAEVGVVRVGKFKNKVTGTFGWCDNCRGLRTFVVERTPESDQPPSDAAAERLR
jgi:hypothetical protein